jgi:Fe-S-cluster containining protein
MSATTPGRGAHPPRPKKLTTRVEPLLVRPGARYRCFGDGLCCHDIHGIGPLTRKEAVAIRRIDRAGARYSEHFEETMLHTAADGGCHFLLADQRCGIHATLGPEHKPSGCRQFPLGVTATPMGGRVTTEHRCPCRTLGDRPALTPEAVLPSVADSSGRPDPEQRVTGVRLAKGKRMTPFAEWLSIEHAFLARLAAGEPPGAVLEAEPFPALRRGSWAKEAQEFVDARDGTRFGYAIAWFGDAILQLQTGSRPRTPARPWADAFDRAEARSPKPESARAVLADWVADFVWSLKWADERTFAVERAELATRLAIAENVVGQLEAMGVRPDRAAAEALMIVEVVGESEFWGGVVERFVV